MSDLGTPTCKVCHLTTPPPKKCARCHVTSYCSPTCQKADWNAHKPDCCRFSGLPWYDLYRQCKDGTKHQGQLELITWATPENEYDEFPEAMGWGNVIVAEAEDLKREFETEMQGDEARLYRKWPQAFRWTCCGETAQNRFGCDHHGKGETPCTCDFCKMGKRIPDSIHNKRTHSAAGRGLRLPRGPDVRSINRDGRDAKMAEIMRPLLDLPGSEEMA